MALSFRLTRFLILAALLWASASSAQTPSYTFYTLSGGAGPGSTDGPGPAARFFGPSGVAVDGAGNVYIADSGNHAVGKMAADGTVSTLVRELYNVSAVARGAQGRQP
jgi:hypothetical protein